MHRAAFSDESRAELLDHFARRKQDPPQPPRVFAIVGARPMVLVERRGVRHFLRPGVDGAADVQPAQRLHHSLVKRRHRFRAQGQHPPFAAVRPNVERVRPEIELHLKHFRPTRDRPGGQAACIGVQRHVPEMVLRRAERHSDLAHNLRPPVQRVVSLPPFA